MLRASAHCVVRVLRSNRALRSNAWATCSRAAFGTSTEGDHFVEDVPQWVIRPVFAQAGAQPVPPLAPGADASEPQHDAPAQAPAAGAASRDVVIADRSAERPPPHEVQARCDELRALAWSMTECGDWARVSAARKEKLAARVLAATSNPRLPSVVAATPSNSLALQRLCTIGGEASRLAAAHASFNPQPVANACIAALQARADALQSLADSQTAALAWLLALEKLTAGAGAADASVIGRLAAPLTLVNAALTSASAPSSSASSSSLRREPGDHSTLLPTLADHLRGLRMLIQDAAACHDAPAATGALLEDALATVATQCALHATTFPPRVEHARSDVLTAFDGLAAALAQAPPDAAVSARAGLEGLDKLAVVLLQSVAVNRNAHAGTAVSQARRARVRMTAVSSLLRAHSALALAVPDDLAWHLKFFLSNAAGSVKHRAAALLSGIEGAAPAAEAASSHLKAEIGVWESLSPLLRAARMEPLTATMAAAVDEATHAVNTASVAGAIAALRALDTSASACVSAKLGVATATDSTAAELPSNDAPPVSARRANAVRHFCQWVSTVNDQLQVLPATGSLMAPFYSAPVLVETLAPVSVVQRSAHLFASAAHPSVPRIGSLEWLSPDQLYQWARVVGALCTAVLPAAEDHVRTPEAIRSQAAAAAILREGMFWLAEACMRMERPTAADLRQWLATVGALLGAPADAGEALRSLEATKASATASRSGSRAEPPVAELSPLAKLLNGCSKTARSGGFVAHLPIAAAIQDAASQRGATRLAAAIARASTALAEHCEHDCNTAAAAAKPPQLPLPLGALLHTIHVAAFAANTVVRSGAAQAAAPTAASPAAAAAKHHHTVTMSLARCCATVARFASFGGQTLGTSNNPEGAAVMWLRALQCSAALGASGSLPVNMLRAAHSGLGEVQRQCIEANAFGAPGLAAAEGVWLTSAEAACAIAHASKVAVPAVALALVRPVSALATALAAQAKLDDASKLPTHWLQQLRAVHGLAEQLRGAGLVLAQLQLPLVRSLHHVARAMPLIEAAPADVRSVVPHELLHMIAAPLVETTAFGLPASLPRKTLDQYTADVSAAVAAGLGKLRPHPTWTPITQLLVLGREARFCCATQVLHALACRAEADPACVDQWLTPAVPLIEALCSTLAPVVAAAEGTCTDTHDRLSSGEHAILCATAAHLRVAVVSPAVSAHAPPPVQDAIRRLVQWLWEGQRAVPHTARPASNDDARQRSDPTPLFRHRLTPPTRGRTGRANAAIIEAVEVMCRAAGLPDPVLNHYAPEACADVDIAWPDLRVGLNIDGLQHFQPAPLDEQVRRLQDLVEGGYRAVADILTEGRTRHTGCTPTRVLADAPVLNALYRAGWDMLTFRRPEVADTRELPGALTTLEGRSDIVRLTVDELRECGVLERLQQLLVTRTADASV